MSPIGAADATASTANAVALFMNSARRRTSRGGAIKKSDTADRGGGGGGGKGLQYMSRGCNK